MTRCPWGPYRDTTLVRPRAHGPLRIDLSKPIDRAAAAELEPVAGRAFAIVTAYNPFFLARGPSTPEDNLAAHARLRSALLARRLAHVEADGHANGAPEHVERGFAIACDERTAHELACAFGQDAYFAYADGAFWIRPALDSSKPAVRLGE